MLPYPTDPGAEAGESPCSESSVQRRTDTDLPDQWQFFKIRAELSRDSVFVPDVCRVERSITDFSRATGGRHRIFMIDFCWSNRRSSAHLSRTDQVTEVRNS
jgi:hypothetical protein